MSHTNFMQSLISYPNIIIPLPPLPRIFNNVYTWPSAVVYLKVQLTFFFSRPCVSLFHIMSTYSFSSSNATKLNGNHTVKWPRLLPVLNRTIPLRHAYSVASTCIALNLAMISCSARISVTMAATFSDCPSLLSPAGRQQYV